MNTGQGMHASGMIRMGMGQKQGKAAPLKQPAGQTGQITQAASGVDQQVSLRAAQGIKAADAEFLDQIGIRSDLGNNGGANRHILLLPDPRGIVGQLDAAPKIAVDRRLPPLGIEAGMWLVRARQHPLHGGNAVIQRSLGHGDMVHA